MAIGNVTGMSQNLSDIATLDDKITLLNNYAKSVRPSILIHCEAGCSISAIQGTTTLYAKYTGDEIYTIEFLSDFGTWNFVITDGSNEVTYVRTYEDGDVGIHEYWWGLTMPSVEISCETGCTITASVTTTANGTIEIPAIYNSTSGKYIIDYIPVYDTWTFTVTKGSNTRTYTREITNAKSVFSYIFGPYNYTVTITAVSGVTVTAVNSSNTVTITDVRTESISNSTNKNYIIDYVPSPTTGTWNFTLTKNSKSITYNKTLTAGTNTYTFLFTVEITCESGCTISGTDGTNTLSATYDSTSGKYNIDFIPTTGLWTFTVTKSSKTTTFKRNLSTATTYAFEFSPNYHKYTYKIKSTESDPTKNVTWHDDCESFTTPAAMNYATGKFNYGDWADVWFITENRPAMLKYNGTVDYYLNPDDYSKKADGTASDIANTSYGGNAMACIPKCYVKRWSETTNNVEYYCVSISEGQPDEDYKAYAHTNSNGVVQDYFWYSMFEASVVDTKNRSLSGKAVVQSQTTETQCTYSKNNNTSISTPDGQGWYIHSWSQKCLINDLLVLISKTTDTQTAFGNGNVKNAGDSSSSLIQTGTLNTSGQFMGYAQGTDTAKAVKVFHIENYWGNQWDRCCGLILDYSSGYVYTKMTPQNNGYVYTATLSDYTSKSYVKTSAAPSVGEGKYIQTMNISDQGMIPVTYSSGSSTTYFCDGYWRRFGSAYPSGTIGYLLCGGSAWNAAADGGAFSFSVDDAPSVADWIRGSGLSFLA